MCGIIGVINPTQKYAQGVNGLIPDMLVAGSLRGADSTGLMKVTDGVLSYDKAVGPGWEFISSEEFLRLNIQIGHSTFVVGHNRSATRGVIKKENAHPFEYEHICLVHNGTVAKVSELHKKGAEVDSELIAMSIAERGVQETTNALWGAYSLVWYNKQEQSLNFLRNKDRPMWFLRTKQDIIAFCSEPQMGQWLLERRGYVVTEVTSTDEDKLYSFDGNTKCFHPTVKEMAPQRKVWIPPQPKLPQKEGLSDQAKDHLKKIARTFRNGEIFKFSLNDFDEEKKTGKFIQIFGEHPSNNFVTCVGNYSGDVELLYTLKTLMYGIISSVAVSKRLGKVVIGLRNVTISGEPDPFFVKLEKEHKKPENKVIPILSGTSCALCSHPFSRDGHDIPYLVTNEDGGKEVVCVVCFMDRPAKAKAKENSDCRTWH